MNLWGETESDWLPAEHHQFDPYETEPRRSCLSALCLTLAAWIVLGGIVAAIARAV